MILLLLAGVVLLMLLVLSESRLRTRLGPPTLGQMSERWLIEHRASHWK